jgi:hypothetical protein
LESAGILCAAQRRKEKNHYSGDFHSDFFHTYLFPVIFRQDPSYYRKLEGNTVVRIGHAFSHIFVAESDSGGRMFNFSEWLGTPPKSS